MKGDFIKKNWQKDAGDVAINAAIRGAGALGAAFAATKWMSYRAAGVDEKGNEIKETSETLQNISGPLLTLAGVLGDMMFADDKIKSFCQGVSAYGLIRTIAVISPEAKLGFKIDKKAESNTGVNGMDTAQMFGLNALGTTAETSETYTGDKPQELNEFMQGQSPTFDTDGKTYNNDWAYLAENIEHADEITKAVNGVDDEEHVAELMGTDNAEEAALLMDMF